MKSMPTIFISSTTDDLKGYRKAVSDVLLQFEVAPLIMDYFGAQSARPKDVCLQRIQGSDAFIGIYAHRYGSILKGDNESITELEYNQAIKFEKPALIYILDDKKKWPPAFMDEGKEATKLVAFKKRLLDRHICHYFTNKENLAKTVAVDIVRQFPFSFFKAVDLEKAADINPASIDQWNKARIKVYENNSNVFLAHSLRRSKKENQKYEIAIYLIAHNSNDPRYVRNDLSDIVRAEFFLGQYFGNKVFVAKNNGGKIGISVSAYGSFLCTCRIHFSDNRCIMINRYIDFEMGPKISAS